MSVFNVPYNVIETWLQPLGKDLGNLDTPEAKQRLRVAALEEQLRQWQEKPESNERTMFMKELEKQISDAKDGKMAPPINPPPLKPPPRMMPSFKLKRPQVDYPKNFPDDGKSAKERFAELKDPIGAEGSIFKAVGMTTYTPSQAMELPGSNFSEICPGQDFVNRKAVEAKIANGLPASPVIPVTIIPMDDRIVLLDKHHTFVACMALKRPVKLALLPSGGTEKAGANWGSCDWKGFDKPKGALKAIMTLSKEESEEHEGGVVVNEDWKDIVPWRKDKPKTPEEMTNSVVEMLGTLLDEEQLKEACACDPSVAEMLYEILKIDMVTIEMREVRKGDKSSGGDWDPEKNKIFLDEDLSPLELVDMLVFEGQNALRQAKFGALAYKAHNQKLDPRDVGEDRAKIEAETTIAYIEHLIARQEAGLEIAEQGQIALAKANKRIPGYTTMSKKQREEKAGAMTTFIINTPHGGTDDEGNPKRKLPDRLALSTSVIYFYERVADTQNVSGIIAHFQGLLDNAKIDKENAKRKAFLAALKTVPQSPEQAPPKPPKSWAGLFYHLAAKSANAIFKLKVTEFSGPILAVAKGEYKDLRGAWESQLGLALLQAAMAQETVPEPVEQESTENLSPEEIEYREKMTSLKNKRDQHKVRSDPWETLHKRVTAAEEKHEDNVSAAIAILNRALHSSSS